MESLTTQIILWALGIIATLSGGLNVMQLITFRAYKRKNNAEADNAEIDALRKIIDQNTAELGRLQQRVENADRRALEQDGRYNELYDKYNALREEFLDYKLTHK